jgi:hypothetical protein
MALTWVKIVRPAGGSGDDDVYLNGQYVDASGIVGAPFQVDSGQNTFETLDPNGAPEWRKLAQVGGAASPGTAQEVVLERVALASIPGGGTVT